MGDNDAYVGACINAYSMFIRRAEWTVRPASKEKKDLEAAEFLESCMNDMGHSWQSLMAMASRATIQYGFAPFEKIFKVRNGENEDDDRYGSEYDDGLIGWSNIAFRSPDTVLNWNFDPSDPTRLRGLTQLAAPDWQQTFIPIEKLLLLRADPGKDSPEGRSILRSAYRSWRTKKIMEDFRNIIIERGGAGIPWAEVPANIANATAFYDPTNPASVEAKASYDSIAEMLENICQDTQKYVITPQIWDDKTGKEQIKISFLQPAMGADIVGHITNAITVEANAILVSTMTEFLTLGTGATGGGSLALSRDKTDNFTLAVTACLDSFENSINTQLTRQLFRLNPQFEDLDELPRIVHDPVVPLNTNDIMAIISLFEKAGWGLKNQTTIRDTVLQAIGLPDYEEDTALESDETDGEGKPVDEKAAAIQQVIEAKKSARTKSRRQKKRENRAKVPRSAK